MTLWGEVYKELKKKNFFTHMSEVDGYIVQLNKELEATTVNQKEKIVKNYVLKLLIKHKYRFLGRNGGGNRHYFRSSMRLDSKKTKQLLRSPPKLSNVFFLFSIF